jgi:hypothetical protein
MDDLNREAIARETEEAKIPRLAKLYRVFDTAQSYTDLDHDRCSKQSARGLHEIAGSLGPFRPLDPPRLGRKDRMDRCNPRGNPLRNLYERRV